MFEALPKELRLLHLSPCSSRQCVNPHSHKTEHSVLLIKRWHRMMLKIGMVVSALTDPQMTSKEVECCLTFLPITMVVVTRSYNMRLGQPAEDETYNCP